MSLFYPQIMLHRVQQLSPEGLRRRNRGILLDVDRRSPYGARLHLVSGPRN